MVSEMANKNVSPPYTNRGADNTYRDGLKACVDWVQATLEIVSVEQLITDILGLDFNDFYNGQSGKYGYKNSKHLGNIGIFYDGREDMGIHLEITGQGCREYESLNIQSWKELFGRLIENEANFTRLDIAIDDFKGHFNISGLVRKIKNRELISKFKNAVRIESIDIETGESKGNTIYYGGSSSRIQIRMYEKDHERMAMGYELDGDVETWNRTEVQARNERAQKIAELVAEREEGSESIGEIVSGILRYYMRFVVKGKDTNRARWNTAPFWLKFLGDVKALRLTDIAPDRTVEKTAHWIDKQVAPSLAILFNAFDGDMDILKQFIIDGSDRLKDKDYAMIDRFKREQEEITNMLESKKIAFPSQYEDTATACTVDYQEINS